MQAGGPCGPVDQGIEGLERGVWAVLAPGVGTVLTPGVCTVLTPGVCTVLTPGVWVALDPGVWAALAPATLTRTGGRRCGSAWLSVDAGRSSGPEAVRWIRPLLAGGGILPVT